MKKLSKQFTEMIGMSDKQHRQMMLQAKLIQAKIHFKLRFYGVLCKFIGHYWQPTTIQLRHCKRCGKLE